MEFPVALTCKRAVREPERALSWPNPLCSAPDRWGRLRPKCCRPSR